MIIASSVDSWTSLRLGLFFAKGLLVVEGDAEAILLPSLARRLGKDLTKHGVSIINVGGVGLRRYSKILQRKDASEGEITVPTACITDMDVMPDCAPEILGLKGVKSSVWPDKADRRWRAMKDFGSTPSDRENALKEHRDKRTESDGQCVRTFVADHWTLEYDLAFKGLSKEVHHAGFLAIHEDKMDDGKETKASLLKKLIQPSVRSRPPMPQRKLGALRSTNCSKGHPKQLQHST